MFSNRKELLKINISKARPVKENPATARPMTEPLEKATLKALERPCSAPAATLVLALVAAYIPITPANSETRAPNSNAIGYLKDWKITPRTAAIMTATRNIFLASSSRKADAPS